MALGHVFHVGTFLLLVATVLLLVTSISSPVIPEYVTFLCGLSLVLVLTVWTAFGLFQCLIPQGYPDELYREAS